MLLDWRSIKGFVNVLMSFCIICLFVDFVFLYLVYIYCGNVIVINVALLKCMDQRSIQLLLYNR